MANALPLLVVVALVAVTSIVLRRRTGVVRRDHHAFTTPELTAAGLDGRRPAFVIFTAPGCRTCGPTRTLVEDVAAAHDVPVVVLDATEHEDLAASHRVLRAPTTFLLHTDGRIAGRVAGLPRVPDLAVLLGASRQGVETAA